MEKFTLEELLNSENAISYMDENLSSYNNDLDVVEAVLEINYGHYDSERKETLYDMDDLEDAVEKIEKGYITYYNSIDDYHDSCDDLLDFGGNDFMERYFDFESYHDDCDYNVTEASNGIVICNY